MRGKIIVRWRFRSLQAHDIKNIDNIRSYGRNKVDVRLGTKILWLCVVFFFLYDIISLLEIVLSCQKFGQLLLLYSFRHSGHISFSLPCQSFFRIYIVIYFFFRFFFCFFLPARFFFNFVATNTIFKGLLKKGFIFPAWAPLMGFIT